MSWKRLEVLTRLAVDDLWTAVLHQVCQTLQAHLVVRHGAVADLSPLAQGELILQDPFLPGLWTRTSVAAAVSLAPQIQVLGVLVEPMVLLHPKVRWWPPFFFLQGWWSRLGFSSSPFLLPPLWFVAFLCLKEQSCACCSSCFVMATVLGELLVVRSVVGPMCLGLAGPGLSSPFVA